MHALPGGEVQGKVFGICGLLFVSSCAQPDQPGRQDLADLQQPLVGGHAVGIERVGYGRGFSWRAADIRMLYIGF